MSVHTGDINKPIDVETNFDLTGGTVVLRVVPPKAKKRGNGTWNPTFEYSGEINGTKIRHLKTSSTFDKPGKWRVQAKVTFSNGRIEYGTEAILEVFASY